MSYKGKYRVKDISKYDGDHSRVQYRSLWERQVFRWLDDNVNVLKWSSEEVVVPYRCKTDNRMHRYFVDIKVQFRGGVTYLIEIKPKKETMPPKVRERKTRGYLMEVLTYAKNISKWESATEYAKDRGWIFEIWTEQTLAELNIKILYNSKTKKKSI